MKNLKPLSKAEMKKVSGGIIMPKCTTEQRSCYVVEQGSDPWPQGYMWLGECGTAGGGACVCTSIAYPTNGGSVTQQTGDCYE